tara:strand:+ start:396 stop:533 length:138 start_codon:yes stop_codon:yes gene_type:complete
MDVFGCQGPPTKFETFMAVVAIVGIALCVFVVYPFMFLIAIGVIQ